MPHTVGRMADPKTEWVARVRAAMANKGVSARGLARLMAEQDGQVKDSAVESRRRKINKWLSLEEETLPDEDGQRQLGEILGANLRARREPAATRILRRLEDIEAGIDALSEGQKTGFAHLDELRELLVAVKETLDAQPREQRTGRQRRAQ